MNAVQKLELLRGVEEESGVKYAVPLQKPMIARVHGGKARRKVQLL